MLFACDFVSSFGGTTLWEGKISQSVSTIVSEVAVVTDITGVLSAQTSSFIFTVQTDCKLSVYSIICHTHRRISWRVCY